MGTHKIWVKLDSACQGYQRAIITHPDQSKLAFFGGNDLDLTVTVARGQLPQILIDYDKIDEPIRNIGLTKTTYSPGESKKHDSVLIL